MGKDIESYRALQRMTAIYRDNKLCTRHYFLLFEFVKGDHVHHVYGRSSTGNWKEHYTNLLCLCVNCHNLYGPLSTKGDTEQEFILKKANETPINPLFSHEQID